MDFTLSIVEIRPCSPAAAPIRASRRAAINPGSSSGPPSIHARVGGGPSQISKFMTISERIDLGIAVAHASHRGKQLTCEEIASYCDCSRNTINLIEKRAVRKIRRLLRRAGIAGDLAEALRSL